VRFSEPYRVHAEAARRAGWPVWEIPAGHFHMLVDPAAVAGVVLDAAAI
jgi:hypothetical protein